jgi:aryl-alcohol dehydrogenase-like predicted oxidoreductase
VAEPEIFKLGGDLEVRRLGFGAMRLCGRRIMGWPENRENALAVLRRAVELGVNLIDTSNAYGPEVNELQIAEALHPYPKLKAACDGSLKRLRLERIDVYQLHAPDPKVPIEESVGALRDLRDEGKIKHVGLSNVDVEELERAQSVVPIVSVQNEYNLGFRESEDVLDECERQGLAFLPWYPLSSGSLAQHGRLDAIARKHDATPAQVAIAWLLQRSPVMVPIPGTSSLAHLEENMGGDNIRLSDEDFAALAA